MLPTPRLKELMATRRLPQRPMPRLRGGTCGEYWEFKHAFQRHIGEAPIPYALKFLTLLSAFTGRAKKSLRACLQIEDTRAGYKQALALLEERYGNKQAYNQELIGKVLRGPAVRTDDIKGLQVLADDLGNCRCQTFLNMSTGARTSLVCEERRCFACLDRTHRMAECIQKTRCGIDGCYSFHSNLLHFSRNSMRNNMPNQDEPSKKELSQFFKG
ncbi:uncharacterized protein LOC121855974 [Homarus americanus]|uniref:uncharacterized protein LOC121855974 n=1 Tax=Homarus americanus TaxID=6706 RepID=UPI001C43F56C|nr:uncharacterized protein LOC121855974 [Homarus americanus]